ncbi:MAG TPA: hypothetical protein VK358_05485 [Longimicrobium sp.]|nr:hypothetical protein [Longimicrobium sp.]
MAQVADTLTAADRVTIAQRVLRARGTEFHDHVLVDRAALTRVLGAAPAAGSELVSLLGDPCGGTEQGRWSVRRIELAGDGDVLLDARRVVPDGSARTETYRLRRTCPAAGACGWWLVDIRLSDFGSNDVVPLPGALFP